MRGGGLNNKPRVLFFPLLKGSLPPFPIWCREQQTQDMNSNTETQNLNEHNPGVRVKIGLLRWTKHVSAATHLIKLRCKAGAPEMREDISGASTLKQLLQSENLSCVLRWIRCPTAHSYMKTSLTFLNENFGSNCIKRNPLLGEVSSQLRIDSDLFIAEYHLDCELLGQQS